MMQWCRAQRIRDPCALGNESKMVNESALFWRLFLEIFLCFQGMHDTAAGIFGIGVSQVHTKNLADLTGRI